MPRRCERGGEGAGQGDGERPAEPLGRARGLPVAPGTTHGDSAVAGKLGKQNPTS